MCIYYLSERAFLFPDTEPSTEHLSSVVVFSRRVRRQGNRAQGNQVRVSEKDKDIITYVILSFGKTKDKIQSLGFRGLPRITRAPPRGQEDEFLDFASFSHRGGDNTVDGVVFM